MEFIGHVIVHALEDTLPIVPFLLLTYVALEALEHAAGDRVNAWVKRAGASGPVVGAALGVMPQCGFSAMGATLYAGRVITLGTLMAVFLSTSDEMLPMLAAERVRASELVWILAIKAVVAAVVGLAVDALVRGIRRNERVHAFMRRGVFGVRSERDVIDELAEAGEGADHIHRLCERDHCGCEPEVGSHEHRDRGEHGHSHEHDHGRGGAFSILRSALSHTVQVTLFIFIVSIALIAVLETVGEPALEAFLRGNRVLSIFAAALVGLIPNCAASVVITQLYLEGVLSLGAMISGTLVGAGTGLLVLFRTNRSMRENAIIVAALYIVGAASGVMLTALGF